MKRYTKAQKQQILEEVAEIGNARFVARKNKIPSSTIQTWLKSKANSADTDIGSVERLKALKKALTDKELEIQILRELLKKNIRSLAARLAVSEYYINQGYKVRKVLRYAGVASSTWYYNRARKGQEDRRRYNKGRPLPGYSINPDGTIVLDELIVDAIRRYRNSAHFSNGGGYRKLKYYLRKDYGYYINHKKLYRICKENELLLPVRRKLKRKARRVSINREIYKPNELWELDIKYGYIHGLNRFFFILVYIDIYSRKVVDYYVGLTCTSNNLSATLDFALAKANIGEEGLVIRSDNGPQMSSNQFRKHLLLLSSKIEHEFIPCATPNKNAHVESFFSTVEREFIEVNYFKDFNEVAIKFSDFIEFYNNDRVHGSLNYKTPEDIIEDYNNNGYNPKIRNLRV